MGRRARLVLFGAAVFAVLVILSTLFMPPDPMTNLVAYALALVVTPVIVYAVKDYEAVSGWMNERDGGSSDTDTSE